MDLLVWQIGNILPIPNAWFDSTRFVHWEHLLRINSLFLIPGCNLFEQVQFKKKKKKIEQVGVLLNGKNSIIAVNDDTQWTHDVMQYTYM